MDFNLTVVSLSVARMADAIGNSILYIIIPIYVDKLPEKLIPLPKVFLIGILISAYGFATAGLQPFMAGTLGIISYRLPFLVDGGLCLAGVAVVYFFMGETVDRKPFGRRSHSISGQTGDEDGGPSDTSARNRPKGKQNLPLFGRVNEKCRLTA